MSHSRWFVVIIFLAFLLLVLLIAGFSVFSIPSGRSPLEDFSKEHPHALKIRPGSSRIDWAERNEDLTYKDCSTSYRLVDDRFEFFDTVCEN